MLSLSESLPDETSALLAGDGAERTPIPASLYNKAVHPQRTVALVAVLMMFVAGSGSLLTVPQTRLVEDVLCRKYYKDSLGDGVPIDEKLCKNGIVQSELAYIMGTSDTVDAITGLIVLLPYGILADRIGRRFVVVLSSMGTVMVTIWIAVALRFWPSIPIETVILAPFLQIVGGGASVLIATAYSLVADAVPESARTRAFSALAVASYIGRVASGLVAAKLMQVFSPWLPLLSSIFGIALGTSLIIWVPEAVHTKIHGNNSIQYEVEERSSLTIRVRSFLARVPSRIRRAFAALPSVSVLLVFLAFFGQGFKSSATGHSFMQYISKRFHWTLAEAAYLLPISGIASMAILLLGLPTAGVFLTSYTRLRLSPVMKDVVLARFSALFIALGALLMGAGGVVPVVGAGQVVLTLGDGLVPLCRTIVASYFEPHQFSTLYTMVSFVETTGSMFSGPAFAGFLSKGMELGPPWLGLPYFGLSMLFTGVFILLLFVKIPPHAHRLVTEEDAEE